MQLLVSDLGVGVRFGNYKIGSVNLFIIYLFILFLIRKGNKFILHNVCNHLLLCHMFN